MLQSIVTAFRSVFDPIGLQADRYMQARDREVHELQEANARRDGVMSIPDKSIIYNYASTQRFGQENAGLREAAIAAHRRNIERVGVRGNIYQMFMAEVDNPVPDLALRNTYRATLLLDYATNHMETD